MQSISPVNGPTAGGTSVTITGTGFAAGATVAIGGNPCTSVTVVSSTSITCTTPPHAAGAVDVVVSVGTLQSSLPGSYTYIAPAAPEAPKSATSTAGNASATVNWAASSGPISTNYPVTSYTATATPGNSTCTTTTLTCTITGLTNGTNYTVSVTATNAHGTSTPTSAGTVTPTDVTISITGKRAGRDIVINGTSSLSAGDKVTPMVVAGKTGKAKAGKPIPVRGDGTFTWKSRQEPTLEISVYFTSGNAQSNTAGFAAQKATLSIKAKRGNSQGTKYEITVTGQSNLPAGTRVQTRIRLAGEAHYSAGQTVKTNKNGDFKFTFKTTRGAYVFTIANGTMSERRVIAPL